MKRRLNEKIADRAMDEPAGEKGAQTLRRLAWVLAIFGLLIASCTDPAGSVADGVADQVGAPAQASGEQQTSDGQAGDGQTDSGQANGEKQESIVEQIQVRSVSAQSREAREVFRQNFEGFLERRELGFSWELFKGVITSVDDRFRDLQRIPTELRQLSPPDIFDLGAPFIVVTLFVAIFFLVDRQLRRWTRYWQARLHLEVSRWVTRLVRGFVLVLGRVVSVAFLVLLSYFPIQAFFGGEIWTTLLTDLLWLFLVYRAVIGTLRVLFSGRVIEMQTDHAARIERFGVFTGRFVFIFFGVFAVVERLGISDPAYAFLLFVFKVSLALLPIYLFFIKSSVMDLLPEAPASSFYRIIRATIDRNYYWLLAVTVGLLALRAGGFVWATTFILVRGYGILLLVVLTFISAARLREYFESRREAESEPDGAVLAEGAPVRVAEHIEKLVLIGGGFLLFVVILKLLYLWEPLVLILRIHFLEVGRVRVSFLNVFSVIAIVFGAVLVSKLLRAVLNSRIYPLFGLDVGVAYAINRIVNYILVAAAFFLVLAALGVDLTAITVVAASLGVGIGFGLQTLTENLISGFIILFGRSVQKGDFITVNDIYGKVDAVGARSVVLKTPDNYDMLIPSKEIVGGQIINWTYRDSTVRVRVPVGVSYEAEPEEVKEVLLGVCEDNDLVLKHPPPEAWLVEFGDSAVNFELLVYFDCREATPPRLRGQLNYEIWDALKEAEIGIPFPQRDLHLKSSEAFQKWRSVAEDDDGQP